MSSRYRSVRSAPSTENRSVGLPRPLSKSTPERCQARVTQSVSSLRRGVPTTPKGAGAPAATYCSGGRSGPSAYLRAIGSRSGSSSQLVHRSPSGILPEKAFIGLPHAGHAFWIGHCHPNFPCAGQSTSADIAIGIATRKNACACLALLDSDSRGYSTLGSDVVGVRHGAGVLPGSRAAGPGHS